MVDRRSLLLLTGVSAVLAGCPGPAVTDDAAVAPMPDAFAPMPDAFTPDAFTADMPDAFMPVMPDAFVPGDAGPDPLPPITDPTAHLVPTSADGHDRFFGVTFAPDSSFYVVGVRAAGTDATTADFETIVGHFTAAGDLDTTFGTGGRFGRNLAVGLGGEVTRGVALQSDGKIIVASTIEHVAMGADARDRDVALFRLNTDGTLDTTFGTMGVAVHDLSDGEAVPAPGTGYAADAAWNVVVDSMDRLVVAVGLKRTGGTDTDFGVMRLTANGPLDPTFATGRVYALDLANTSRRTREVTILDDGTIALGGYFTQSGSIRPLALRLDANGAPITAFGTGGYFSELILMAQVEIYSLSIQGTSFITSGYGRDLGPEDNDLISMRLDIATGARDLSYGTSGLAILSGFDFNDNIRVHRGLPDGRSMFAGAMRTTASTADAAIVIFTRDGAPDTSFDTDGVFLANLGGGTIDHFWGLAIDPRGERAVAVGIGGTEPATDDDGLVYLLPIP